MSAHLITVPGLAAWTRLLCICALAVVCGAAAEPVQQPEPNASARFEHDKSIVDAALRAVQSGGAPLLALQIANLADVQSHTPTGYRKVETSNGEIRYRAETIADFLEFLSWQTRQPKTPGAPDRKILWLPNTYIKSSFLLGWYFNETRQPEQALAALDRGLGFTPGEASLIGEKGQALIRLRRIDAALEIYDQTLSAKAFMPVKLRALLLRARGFCLTEKQQFDAAERSYRESLELEPDHAGALKELTYIAKVRAGGAPTGPVMTTYDKMKQGDLRGAKP